MLFTNKKVEQYPNILIQNSVIQRLDTFSYLGVIIDDELKYQSHIQAVNSKMAMYLCIIKKLQKFLNINAAKYYYFIYDLWYIGMGRTIKYFVLT